MEGQLPLIDGTTHEAWHLADDVRRRGLRGIHEARQALEAARRRRIGGDDESVAERPQAAGRARQVSRRSLGGRRLCAHA